FQAMGAVEQGGRWHQATGIAAPAGAVASRFTTMTSVSCARGGWCLAAGTFAVTSVRDRAMTVTVSGGRFGRAVALTARPRGGPAAASTALAAVSCRSRGDCTAAGVASNRSGQFVAADAV